MVVNQIHHSRDFLVYFCFAWSYASHTMCHCVTKNVFDGSGGPTALKEL